MFCLLYSSALTTIHDPFGDHSLDYTDLCRQSNNFFSTSCLGLSSFSCQEAIVFWLMAAVTIRSDFGAQEEEICHYLHHSPLYLPWSYGARCHDLSWNVGSFRRWLLNECRPANVRVHIRVCACLMQGNYRRRQGYCRESKEPCLPLSHEKNSKRMT